MTPGIEQSLADRRRHYDRIDWSVVEPYQLEVRRDALRLLPQDARSILDLGCGNGVIANALPQDRMVVGFDISLAALRRVIRPRCLGSMTALPFADRSFDLAMANDVIEHLPEDEFAAALAQIGRVASRYIITTVPFAEDLRAGRRYSPEADALRHVNEHMRAFDLPTLAGLYPDFDLDSVVFSGVEWQRETRPVEAFKHLTAAIEAAPGLRRTVAGEGLSEESAEILRWLRAQQARALGRAPDLFDLCRLRTEAICLYRRRPTAKIGPIAHAVRARSRAADVVPLTPVDLCAIDFRRLDRHRLPWLPTMARLPYVVTSADAAATADGTRFAAPAGDRAWDVKLGFFCNFEGPSRLEIIGEAVGSATLSIAHYGAAHDYRQIGAERVEGEFRIGIGVDLSHSQYGALFCIAPAGDDVVFHRVSIAAAEPLQRPICETPPDYLQRTRDGIDCFLSCGYYKADAPVPAWFENPAAVSAGAVPPHYERPRGCTANGGAPADQPTGELGARLRAVEEASRRHHSTIEKLIAEVGEANGSAQRQAVRLHAVEDALSRHREALERLIPQVHDAGEAVARSAASAEDLGRRLGIVERVLSPLMPAAHAVHRIRQRVMRAAPLSEARPLAPETAAPAIATVSEPPPVPTDPSRAVVMLVADDRIDRRVLAQARSLARCGWQVSVIAVPFPEPTDLDRLAFPEIRIVRIDTDAPSPPLPASLWLRTRLRPDRDWKQAYFYHDHFLAQALAIPAAIVTAHDLPVLPAAIMAADHHGARLVYDAHELYPEQHHFGPERQALYREVESEVIGFADAVTTINQSIAETMAARYGVPLPRVVLNAVAVDPASLPMARGNRIRDRLNLPCERKILLYQGGLSANRNLENLTQAAALARTPGLALVFLGPGSEKRAELQAIATGDCTLDSRVFFLDAVDQSELLEHTASADVGVIPYPPIDLNSRYCTPNKLFEYIVAGLPILANDLPELRRFVHDTGFGEVHALDEPAAIAAAIDRMFASDLDGYRRRLDERSKEFTWEPQAGTVCALYEKLRPAVSVSGGQRLANSNG